MATNLLEHVFFASVSGPLSPGYAPRRRRAALTSESTAFRRAQSAFDLFRLDELQSGEQEKFKKGQAADLVRKFDALPIPIKERYELLSEGTKPMALANREGDREQRRPAERAPWNALLDIAWRLALALADASLEPGDVFDLQPFALSILPDDAYTENIPPPPPVLALPWLTGHATQAFDLSTCFRTSLESTLKCLDEEPGRAPLTLTHYQAAKARAGGTKEKLQRVSRSLGHGVGADRKQIPAVVAYEDLCGAICGKERLTNLGSLIERFEALIADWVKRCVRAIGGPIASAELLLRLTSIHPGNKEISLHVWLPAASQRSGRYVPTQTFIRFGPVGEPGMDLLGPRRHPKVVLDRKASLLKNLSSSLFGELGPYEQFCEDELLALLLGPWCKMFKEDPWADAAYATEHPDDALPCIFVESLEHEPYVNDIVKLKRIHDNVFFPFSVPGPVAARGKGKGKDGGEDKGDGKGARSGADLFGGGEKDDDHEASFEFLIKEILGADAPAMNQNLVDLEIMTDEWDRDGQDSEPTVEEHEDPDEEEKEHLDIDYADPPDIHIEEEALNERDGYLESKGLDLNRTLVRRRSGDPTALGRLLPWGGDVSKPETERDVKIQCDRHGRGKCFPFLSTARCNYLTVQRRALVWLMLACEDPAMTCSQHLDAGSDAKKDVGMKPRGRRTLAAAK